MAEAGMPVDAPSGDGAVDAQETIGTRTREGGSVQPPAAVPVIRLGEVDGEGEGDFALHGVIGEGTMGRVYLATQRSVGREVAIKVPRPGRSFDERVEALLREARVTGRLEHPNVVPMHGLARTPDGTVVMVMRRVEGVSWRRVVDGREQMPASFRSADPIEAHLRILLVVCDAIDYAHRRGVLHRDIKLDNVMLGSFGEVYVVDWGLAVALQDDGTGHLPLAATVDEPAGTPGYMAPEMAMAHGHRLGPASDVYCLGAMLHRVLTGRPRHTGRTLAQVLGAAQRSEPFDYRPYTLPRELTDICARATEADPADRYPDVAALRRAIADAIEHLASNRLVAEADRARRALQAAVEPDATEQAFGAARFALEHALRIWPDNPDARRSLDAILLDRADVALAAGRAAHAEQLLAAATGPDDTERKAALAARITAEIERQQHLGRLSRELDLGVFSRGRGWILLGLATLWGSNNIRRALDPPSSERLLLDQVWMVAVVAILGFFARRWMWSNRVNRQMLLAVPCIVVADTISRLVGWRLGLGVGPTTVIELGGDAVVTVFVTLLIDRRFAAAMLTFVTGLWFAMADPEQAFFCKALASFFGLAAVALMWMRRGADERPPV